jgi:valyl-tRNA synthetase
VGAVRQIRGEYRVAPGAGITAALLPATDRARRVFRDESAIIGRLTRADVTVSDGAPAGAAAHALLSDGSQLIVPLEGAIDVEKECARLRAELQQLETQLESLDKRLASDGFVTRAPAEVVEAERRKARDWRERRVRLREKVKQLCGT